MASVVDLNDRYCCDGKNCMPKLSMFALSDGDLWRCPNCRRIWRYRETWHVYYTAKIMMYWERAPWWVLLAVRLRLRRVSLGAR